MPSSPRQPPPGARQVAARVDRGLRTAGRYAVGARGSRTATRATIGARGAALVLALHAGLAAAEWKDLPAATDDGPAIAYDAARIRYEPPHVTAWTRVVLAAPASLDQDIRYRSALQKVAVDCGARTWAITYSEFYRSPDATGVPVFSDSRPRAEWQLRPARAGSAGDRLIRALCTTPRPW